MSQDQKDTDETTPLLAPRDAPWGMDYWGGFPTDPGDDMSAGIHTRPDGGRVGTAPAGPAALYFEVRIDGRPVDPLQWLRRSQ